MKMENNKLVILCGAGFPLMWGAPKSDELAISIKKIIRRKLVNNTSLCRKLLNNDSFETIIAAIESLIYYSISSFNKNYMTSFFKCQEDIDSGILWELYEECINTIIQRIEEYENRVLQDNNIKESIRSLWTVLNTTFKSVKYNTTNYDEILPRVLNWDCENMDLATYANMQNTFSNLHGSIHLCKKYNGWCYEIIHTEKTCRQNNAFLIEGGNPNELMIFFPIITGQNKVQRVMDMYFNRNIITFSNDLSDCNVLLIIGYSFSDPHINMLIKEFVSLEKTRVVVIDKMEEVSNSNLFDRLIRLIPIQTKYKADTSTDDWFSYNNSSVKIYKRGCDKLFSDMDFINNLL